MSDLDPRHSAAHAAKQAEKRNEESDSHKTKQCDRDHPMKFPNYKTKQCNKDHPMESRFCRYGLKCWFAHGATDMAARTVGCEHASERGSLESHTALQGTRCFLCEDASGSRRYNSANSANRASTVAMETLDGCAWHGARYWVKAKDFFCTPAFLQIGTCACADASFEDGSDYSDLHVVSTQCAYFALEESTPEALAHTVYVACARRQGKDRSRYYNGKACLRATSRSARGE